MTSQVLLLATTALLVSVGAQAAVTISDSPTKNVVCSAGVCTPTHKSAVLNAGDLQRMLVTGNVDVTTGSGTLAAETSDIDVNATVSWASNSTLTLDAYDSITVSKALTVAEAGGLSFVTNDGGVGGALSFGLRGNATFGSLNGNLSINGAAYTLVDNIAMLASDIAANPSGKYALAGNYDAAGESFTPIGSSSTPFTGTFEGLGHSINNLTINLPTTSEVGFFGYTSRHAVIQNVGLIGGSVSADHQVGALVGSNNGTVSNSYATGSVTGAADKVGGLVGNNQGNEGTVSNSWASGRVSSGGSGVGGLMGENFGTISNSCATGNVSGVSGVGGLAGDNLQRVISNSYATGNVSASKGTAGGLVGGNSSVINNSYATGSVSGLSTVGGLVGANISSGSRAMIGDSYSVGSVSGSEGDVGGLVGYDDSAAGSLTDTYWDTSTSGITDPSQGAGNVANDSGITGETTTQLQSGLPAGFDPAIWGQSPSINGGLPYLLANPPP